MTTLGENVMETESAFVGTMTPAEFTFENFEKWVNALAENCRKVSKDGNLFESEMISGCDCRIFDAKGFNGMTDVYRISMIKTGFGALLRNPS